MNSELPKVDITYGTKRHGLRKYACLTNALLNYKNTHSIKVTTKYNESFVSNVVKVSGSKNLIIMEDRRLRLSEITTIEIISKRITNKVESSLAKEILAEQSPIHLLTFNLILNKSHALGKKIAVFLKSGCTYTGVSNYRDFDSLQLTTDDHRVILIMYDAVKRIVPLEPDGSLSE
ncbi:hypothetical protein [Providencia sp. PROV236]|uniref:hypothetical protein n=1 Tax=Providencia sp. PROV236 TaxID=2936798 RepID=UPI0034E283BC